MAVLDQTPEYLREIGIYEYALNIRPSIFEKQENFN